MRTFDEWIIVNHPRSHKAVALVFLRDTHFMGYIPLRDPRDSDGDGQVSNSEWIASKIPIFGALKVEAEIASTMMVIAMDSRVTDVQLYQDGQMRTICATLVAVERAISMLYISKIAGAAATLAMTGSTLTGVSYFVAKKGLEQAFEAVINRAIAPFGQQR